MRFIGFILMCLFTLAAVAASDQAKPLVVDAHGSGQWLFNEADYTQCVMVSPTPLQPRQNGVNLYPRRSDTA